jgi:hypothetical protein
MTIWLSSLRYNKKGKCLPQICCGKIFIYRPKIHGIWTITNIGTNSYNYEEPLISEEFDCPLITVIVFKHDHFVSSRDRTVAFPSFVLVSEVEDQKCSRKVSTKKYAGICINADR